MLLFTYGTLQRGNVRNYILDGCAYLGPAKTYEKFLLKDRGDFPLMVELSKTARKKLALDMVVVQGELFNINQETLKYLDRIEGHPDFFTRRQVLIEKPDGTTEMAITYLITPDKTRMFWFNDNVRKTITVKSGVWNKKDIEG
jgi:gamma-glutamylaminecyclotransferase